MLGPAHIRNDVRPRGGGVCNQEVTQRHLPVAPAFEARATRNFFHVDPLMVKGCECCRCTRRLARDRFHTLCDPSVVHAWADVSLLVLLRSRIYRQTLISISSRAVLHEKSSCRTRSARDYGTPSPQY